MTSRAQCWVAVIAGYVILVLPVVSALGQTSDCKVVATSFLSALKDGKAKDAIKCVYSLPGQEDRMAEIVERLCEQAQRANAVPEVSELKEASTIALALVKDVTKSSDKKPDYDAVIFLKRDARWLLVLRSPEIEDHPNVLTKDERAQLEVLRDWESKERKRLVEEHSKASQRPKD